MHFTRTVKNTRSVGGSNDKINENRNKTTADKTLSRRRFSRLLVGQVLEDSIFNPMIRRSTIY